MTVGDIISVSSLATGIAETIHASLLGAVLGKRRIHISTDLVRKNRPRFLVKRNKALCIRRCATPVQEELDTDMDHSSSIMSHGNSDMLDTEFCQGMPMSMFMDGFHRSIHRHDKQRCLIYLVSGWVLDDEDKFKGAVVYSFLLAILMESLSAIRGAASHYVRSPVPRFICLTLIYALQALLGYLLMFLAMTFSVEILLAALVGLCVGNLAFFRYEDFQPHRKRRSPHPTTNPTSEREPLLSATRTTTSRD